MKHRLKEIFEDMESRDVEKVWEIKRRLEEKPPRGIGVTRTQINRIINGTSGLRLDYLHTFSKILNIPIENILIKNGEINGTNTVH